MPNRLFWRSMSRPRWSAGVLLVLLAGIASPAVGHAGPMPESTTTKREAGALKLGDGGKLVEALQRTLNARLSPSPELETDGEFGQETRAAVTRFQESNELMPTGVVGAETWQALGLLVTEDPPVPEPDVVNGEALPAAPPDDLTGPPFVTCRAWAIGDGKTGELLWGFNETEKRDFASTTKIMTAYVVLQLAEEDPTVLDEEVVFSERAAQTRGSSARIWAGERLSVRQLLYGLMLPSGNDASVALAEHFGGRFDPPGKRPDEEDPLERFMAEMNRTAGRLGMQETRYVNPHGLSAEGHLSSARDLLRLSWKAMQNPRFCKYVLTRQHGCRLVGAGGYRRNIVWRNTNQLLATEGYLGVKTGTTPKAGACLVSTGRRGEDELFVIVLGSAASAVRYVDTRNLYRWAWRQRGHEP